MKPKPWYWASFVTPDPAAVRLAFEARAEHIALAFDGSTLCYLPTARPIAEIDGNEVRFYRYRREEADTTRIDLSMVVQDSLSPLIVPRGMGGRRPYDSGRL